MQPRATGRWRAASTPGMRALSRLSVVLAFLFCVAAAPAQIPACNATANAFDLLQQSLAAAKAGNVEDAVFCFYAGQLRRRLEMGLYPPDNEGDESEAVYAYQYQLGASINLVAFDHPAESLAALARYDGWTPRIAPQFRPLWKSSRPVPPAGVMPAIATSKRDFSSHMRAQLTLMLDPAYNKAFHVGRDCNMQPADKAPAPAACTAAAADMLRIEKQRGVEGIATSRAKGE